MSEHSFLVDLVPARPTRLFPDAERVRLDGPNGRPTSYVVLAMIEVAGRDYAMLAREDELAVAVDGDLSIYLFELSWDEDGAPHLAVIDDDDTYAEVFHLFAALEDDE